MADNEVRFPGRGAVRWARTLTVACLAFLTAACGQPHPTLAELRAVPEVSLRPPSAVALVQGASDSNSKMGTNAAILLDIYATNAAPAAVFGYYRRHLGSGWTENPNLGPRLTQWRDSTGWTSDKYQLLIGIDNADYAARVAAAYPAAAGKQTTYELELQARSGS